MNLFKHVLLLFILAAACYVTGIALADSRLGFILFLVVGLIAESAFWVLFWRERRDSRRRQAGGNA